MPGGVFKANFLRWGEESDDISTPAFTSMTFGHRARQKRGGGRPRGLHVQDNIQDTANAYQDVLKISPAKLIFTQMPKTCCTPQR